MGVIPDAPGLPPGAIAAAQFEGQTIVVTERPPDWPGAHAFQFEVFDLSAWHEEDGRVYLYDMGSFYSGNDRAEALAEWEKQAELLRHRDALAEEEEA